MPRVQGYLRPGLSLCTLAETLTPVTARGSAVRVGRGIPPGRDRPSAVGLERAAGHVAGPGIPLTMLPGRVLARPEHHAQPDRQPRHDHAADDEEPARDVPVIVNRLSSSSRSPLKILFGFLSLGWR